MAKKLYRSRESTYIGGVCGGLGEYFDIDPLVVRIITVILALAKGIGIIAYIIAWIAIPRRPEGEQAVGAPPKSSLAKYIPGLILVVVGLVFLIDNIFWWFNFGVIWPLGLIAVGLLLIFKSTNDKKDEGGNNEPIQN
jgi:phage shock protein PspC (stress-responsive transcriptional regulator)